MGSVVLQFSTEEDKYGGTYACTWVPKDILRKAINVAVRDRVGLGIERGLGKQGRRETLDENYTHKEKMYTLFDGVTYNTRGYFARGGEAKYRQRQKCPHVIYV